MPVYLDSTEFINKDFLRLTVLEIQKKNILMESQPPWIKYYNVGNFNPVPVVNFSFDAEIKNEYGQGANACQLSYIILITDDIEYAHPGVLTVKESHVCCLPLSTTPPARTYSRSSDSTEDDDEQAGSNEGKDDAAEEIRCS